MIHLDYCHYYSLEYFRVSEKIYLVYSQSIVSAILSFNLLLLTMNKWNFIKNWILNLVLIYQVIINLGLPLILTKTPIINISKEMSLFLGASKRLDNYFYLFLLQFFFDCVSRQKLHYNVNFLLNIDTKR